MPRCEEPKLTVRLANRKSNRSLRCLDVVVFSVSPALCTCAAPLFAVPFGMPLVKGEAVERCVMGFVPVVQAFGAGFLLDMRN